MLDLFPDRTPIDEWFKEISIPALEQLGKQYVITDFGVKDDGKVYTKEFQAVIDKACSEGGGVIVIPTGEFKIGAVFFKQGVNLYVSEGAILKGSDDPSDYQVMETRIEGESCMYFSGLINVYDIDGFIMCGPGTIDGNGERSWKSFWLRRKWNPKCTNKDEQRARLVYFKNCSNVLVANLTLQNSQFWTNHLYKCNHVKYIGCRIISPVEPVKAPSTDAIDIDVCSDVLIKNCYMAVNDDSVVLKGGKGPWADTDENNGMNERILVEDCVYGFCHGILTCGSESVHNKNILIRRLTVNTGCNLLWLKMRPDTPQRYEYITMEAVKAKVNSFLNINPWTQFYDLKDRKDIPISYADNITMRNVECDCDVFFNVAKNDEQYRLSNFIFDGVMVNAGESRLDESVIDNFTINNLTVNVTGEAAKIRSSIGAD